MYQIFGSHYVPNKSSPVPANWHYLQTGLKQNLEQVIAYYRDTTLSVKSDHLLIRLLQSLNIPLSLPLDRYMANVSNIALNLSMALKFTSAIYRGQFFEGVFYGGHQELIIANDASFDIDYAQKHWQQLSPVTVVRHHVSDLMLRLPDGSGEGSGISVVIVNIPMLALQYRAWTLREESNAAQTGLGERPLSAFIQGYVLPNMLATHLDQVLFNRLWLLEQGQAAQVWNSHAQPFFQIDYSDRLDAFQDQLLVLLKRAQLMNFSEMMQSIPMVHKATLLDTLRLPDMPATFQLMWALSIARLPALQFLFEMAPGGPTQKNRPVVTKILSDINNYRRNSIMKTLPPDMRSQIEQELTFLTDYAGNDQVLVGPHTLI